jgi:hypothetical protein
MLVGYALFSGSPEVKVTAHFTANRSKSETAVKK